MISWDLSSELKHIDYCMVHTTPYILTIVGMVHTHYTLHLLCYVILYVMYVVYTNPHDSWNTEWSFLGITADRIETSFHLD